MGLHFLQLENDAELTAHIHQVKEQELRLKQLTEDVSKRSQRNMITMAVQVDTVSNQLTSLQQQLQLQEGQCTKLNEDLERSYKEVQRVNKLLWMLQQSFVCGSHKATTFNCIILLLHT